MIRPLGVLGIYVPIDHNRVELREEFASVTLKQQPDTLQFVQAIDRMSDIHNQHFYGQYKEKSAWS